MPNPDDLPRLPWPAVATALVPWPAVATTLVLAALTSSCVPSIDDLEDCVVAEDAWQHRDLALATGEFTARFRASPRADGIDGFVGFGATPITDESQMVIAAQFSDGSLIAALNGTNFRPAEGLRYAARELYHFRLAGDVALATYSGFVAEGDGDERVIGASLDFAPIGGTIGTLGVQAEGGLLRVCQVSFAVDVTPMTCAEQFGTVPGFVLCDHTETTCSFNVTKDQMLSCDDACAAGGGRCLGGFANAPANCSPRDPIACTGNGGNDDICVCSRQP